MKKRTIPQDPEDFYLKLLTRGKPTSVVFSSPDDDGSLKKLIQTLSDNILDYIRTQSQTNDLDPLFLPERVVVTTIPQATVQALTVWIDPVHSIAVNYGLMLFVYRVARALAPHIITRTADDPPAPPESEAVSIIATLIDWMASPARAPLIEDWPTGQREVRTAENIAVAAERFVVSHEIAHIARQHLIADSSKIDPSNAKPEDLDNRPFEQEIEADVIGAMLSIDSMRVQGLDPRAGCVGVVMFLEILRLAEEVGAIVADEKHPPAEIRLQTVWEALPQRYGKDSPVLMSWANQMAQLITRIGDLARAERITRREETVKYMDKIFREYPATQGTHRDLRADQAMLNETLTRLRTSPSAVLEAIAANLLDADQYRALADAKRSPDALYKDDRGRRHSIAHFLGRYLPERVRPALGIDWVSITAPSTGN
jgi:hypothetical protein